MTDFPADVTESGAYDETVIVRHATVPTPRPSDRDHVEIVVAYGRSARAAVVSPIVARRLAAALIAQADAAEQVRP